MKQQAFKKRYCSLKISELFWLTDLQLAAFFLIDTHLSATQTIKSHLARLPKNLSELFWGLQLKYCVLMFADHSGAGQQ